MNLKKYKFELSLTDKEAQKLFDICYIEGIKPEAALEGFICDLANTERTHGSDETSLAREYFYRVPYNPTDKKSFTQWLICVNNIHDIAGTIMHIEGYQKEIDYLKEHPEEQSYENEIKELETDVEKASKCINDMYKVYCDREKNPQALEEGLKEIMEYIKLKEDFVKGSDI